MRHTTKGKLVGTKRRALAVACALAGLSSTACVTRGEYDAVVAEGDQLRADLVATEAADRAHRAELTQARQSLAEAEATARELQAELEKSTTTREELRAQLDGTLALNDKLSGELEKLGKDANALVANNAQLSASLQEMRQRLAALRRAQEAAEKRVALYRDLTQKLRKIVDSGNLSIALRDGRMVLRLPNDVLFDSARVDLEPEGSEALEQVAAVLATLGDRDFQVSGHTDNVPIYSPKFPSNWELSAGRALSVVKLLVDHEVDARHLSAAAYGEYDPVGDNNTAEGRARNRRIEITLVPNIEELVLIPDELIGEVHTEASAARADAR